MGHAYLKRGEKKQKAEFEKARLALQLFQILLFVFLR